MGDLSLKALAELLILPPANLLILFAAGLVLARRYGRAGRAVQVAAVLGLYALATPLLANRLLAALEPDAAPAEAALLGSGAGAIVVLSGDIHPETPEYGGETVGALTLERLRYAARLQRASGLPILVTGGPIEGSRRSIADIMRDALNQDFAVPVRWLEERSTTTRENALFSGPILRDAGIAKVLLVTHAWHMPRARLAFSEAGIAAVPAPTMFTPGAIGAAALLPSAKALRTAYFAIHEMLGLVWYRALAAVSPAKVAIQTIRDFVPS